MAQRWLPASRRDYDRDGSNQIAISSPIVVPLMVGSILSCQSRGDASKGTDAMINSVLHAAFEIAIRPP